MILACDLRREQVGADVAFVDGAATISGRLDDVAHAGVFGTTMLSVDGIRREVPADTLVHLDVEHELAISAQPGRGAALQRAKYVEELHGIVHGPTPEERLL